MNKASIKPEHMTSLAGSRLVPKTNDRIILRGAIDTLEAEVLEASLLAQTCGQVWYADALGDVLVLLRSIMKAEVTGESLTPINLFGLSCEEIHKQSHNIKEVFGISGLPVPDIKSGPLALRLNYLRARARETEILAVKAFESEPAAGGIITAFNRLSSAFWWLYCRYLSAM
ncbi:MAG: hypothetical protein FWD78_10915 [Treponema sp.]|nr:hypothetical protein [Treponema sp.]